MIERIYIIHHYNLCSVLVTVYIFHEAENILVLTIAHDNVHVLPYNLISLQMHLITISTCTGKLSF